MSFTENERAKFGAFLHFVDEHVVNELDAKSAVGFIELMLNYDLEDAPFTQQLNTLLSVSDQFDNLSKDIASIRQELCGEGANAHDARVMTSKHFHQKLKKLQEYIKKQNNKTQVIATVQDLRKEDIESARVELEKLNVELQALHEQEVEERKERIKIKKENQEQIRVKRQAEHDELMEELKVRRVRIEREIKNLQVQLQAEHDASVEDRKERIALKQQEYQQARLVQEREREQQANERKMKNKVEKRQMESRQKAVQEEQDRQFRERMARKNRGEMF